jgi:hypothetical protein
VDKETKKIIATEFTNGKRHDFRLFKESRVRFKPGTRATGDSGYQGLLDIHPNSSIPKKNTKNKPLSPADKKRNRAISSERILVEHVISRVKRFKIISDKYRNRRKRFRLRFNLISGIYNFESDM